MTDTAIQTRPAVANDTEDGTKAYRQLPHSVMAEKGLLGALLSNNKAYEKVSEFLRPEHFWLPEHGRIYAACVSLIERGLLADLVTLQTALEQDEGLAAIGGPRYLAELVGSAVTIINAGHYGSQIYDLHLKRELIELGEELVDVAYGKTSEGDVPPSATSQIETAEQHLYDLATKGEYEGGFETFKVSLTKAMELAAAAHKRDGALAGVTTGFRDLDAILGGLHASDLLILAGRPSMGKTALVTNIAYNAAYTHFRSNGDEGAVVGFFSLEMSSEQLATRIISEQVEISSDAIRKGKINTHQFDALSTAVRELNSVPIFIDDTPALTVSALRTRARRLKRQHNLGLIVVDYLQLISPPAGRSDGRVNEVSEITRGLKTLAKELNVPVIALSQLSRAVEQREPPRPQLADLRESGSIEQDADVVMFIYREEYYIARKKPDISDPDKYAKWEERLERAHGLADVIIAKQRHGPIADVPMQFQGEFTRFHDLDRMHGGDPRGDDFGPQD